MTAEELVETEAWLETLETADPANPVVDHDFGGLGRIGAALYAVEADQAELIAAVDAARANSRR